MGYAILKLNYKGAKIAISEFFDRDFIIIVRKVSTLFFSILYNLD